MCTLRGVHQLKSDDTSVPIVGAIATIPSNQHIGCVLDHSLNVKPINEWDMSFPTEIHSLANQYERGQISICGLFSSTVRTQYRHFQGEVNAITRLDS